MSIGRNIGIVTGILSLGTFLYKASEKLADDFFHKIKYSIDPSSVKVDFGLLTTGIKADLIIDNNYSADLNLSNIHMTIFYKKNDTLYELGRTQPNVDTYSLTKNKRTTVSGILFEISNINLPAGLSVLNKPAGQRLLIKISGKVNSLPLETEFWY
jgi:hypothetical protein